MCSSDTPSNYLATNYVYINNTLDYNGDFGPNNIDSYYCLEPDACFVDWIKNQSLVNHPIILEDFTSYYVDNSFNPIIVD